MNNLRFHTINNYKTYRNVQYKKLDISYELFGKPLHSAPIVLVNHALTGNSDVVSLEKGWWKELIGDGRLIDTKNYTVVAFNILGNGYDGTLIDEYKDFTAKDIAQIFYLVLKDLKIEQLHTVIGGSLGGGIAWEMAALYPKYIKYLIPIASDWKATDWIIGHNSIQESILLNSNKPLEDTRKMAMLFYRTPISFNQRFERSKTKDGTQFNVASWLNHHGEKLKNRFTVKAYLMMNNLLTTIDISKEDETIEETLGAIQSTIIQIAVDSDIFFIKEENIKTKAILDAAKVKNEYYEIKSQDGHDAFLIEHEQIAQFLKPVFSKKTITIEGQTQTSDL